MKSEKENAIQKQSCTQRLLHMAKAVTSHLELEHVFKAVMDDAHNLLQADRAVLYLYEKESNCLVSQFDGTQSALKVPVSDENMCTHVYHTGETLSIQNIDKDGRFKSPLDKKIGNAVVESVACVPIKIAHSGKQTIGVLQVINKINGSFFEDEDIALLKVFVSHIAVAVQHSHTNTATNAELRESIRSVKRLHQQLQSTEQKHTELHSHKEKQQNILQFQKL